MECRAGSVADIDTFETIKNGDMVVVRMQQAAVYEIIVYK